ncbi:MAG: prolipoprotein diacylglyceryl transferase [Pirellulaceae bacterium]|nr:prolipoprotein diacylglyceryl transferase [Pirellulaceae bacterium]
MNPHWSYSLIMLAAIGSGWWLLRGTQSQLHLSPREKVAIALGAFCGAMLGAKLPFALSDWEGLRSGTVWFSNGKTIVCGMVGAYVGVELAKWIYEIKVKTGDTFAVPMAVAVGIGRLSCFVAGCCYGTPTELPWGVRFATVDAGAIARHPTQLYEMGFHFLMAAVLSWLKFHGLGRGQLVKLYIVAYLIYRWLSEFIRPEPDWWLGLTGYQWFAMLVAPVFMLLAWHDMTVRLHEEPQSHPQIPPQSRAFDANP